jgi:hypothetical protein
VGRPLPIWKPICSPFIRLWLWKENRVTTWLYVQIVGRAWLREDMKE